MLGIEVEPEKPRVGKRNETKLIHSSSSNISSLLLALNIASLDGSLLLVSFAALDLSTSAIPSAKQTPEQTMKTHEVVVFRAVHIYTNCQYRVGQRSRNCW